MQALYNAVLDAFADSDTATDSVSASYQRYKSINAITSREIALISTECGMAFEFIEADRVMIYGELFFPLTKSSTNQAARIFKNWAIEWMVNDASVQALCETLQNHAQGITSVECAVFVLLKDGADIEFTQKIVRGKSYESSPMDSLVFVGKTSALKRMGGLVIGGTK